MSIDLLSSDTNGPLKFFILVLFLQFLKSDFVTNLRSVKQMPVLRCISGICWLGVEHLVSGDHREEGLC